MEVQKRKLLIIGLILYLIGGIGGGLWKNIYAILVFRGILGIGMGLLIPLTTSLIADFYAGNERTRMMGYSNAVSNLGGIIATLISGWLATINWRLCFGVYSIAFVVLVLVVFGLPEPPKITKDKKRALTINKQVVILAVFAFLINVAFYSFLTNIAIFLKAENIGRADSAGVATSFLTFAGFLSGLLIKNITDLLKHFRVPFAIGCMAIGFVFLSDASTLIAVNFSGFLIGLGLGTLKPIIFIKTTELTPQFSNSFSLSIISSSMFFGKFMSPFILDFIGDILQNSETRFLFNFLGLSFGIAGLMSIIVIYYPGKLFETRFNN